MKKTRLVLVLALWVLGLAATACGTPPEESFGDAPVAVGTPVVGTPVAMRDYKITLDSAKIEEDRLKIVFTIDNTTNTAVASIPFRRFTVKAADGTSLDADQSCGTLKASVPAGKTLDGITCWQTNGITSPTGVKITFSPGASTGHDATWELP